MSRNRSCRHRRPGVALRLAAILLLALVAAPAGAYTVFLKDGTKLTTREKYRIEGDKAILILVSGTEAFYDASEIDVRRTEEFNRVDYGTATVIEGSDAEQIGRVESPEDEVTLGDLLRERGSGLALPEPRRRAPKAGSEDGPEEIRAPRTKAGFVDLLALPRAPYPDSTIVSEVMTYLKGQGVDSVRLFRGSEPDRPLIEIVTASEASVFKALKDSANGLVQIRERYRHVGAFELLLLTEEQGRAGQFTLTPDLARDLVTGEVDPPEFFLRHVEF